ncbi:MAG: glycosyltransferase family 2 protein [Gallionellaceae bacterium]|nr:glycosyltransferase family 2 protein [Gallionellaceae bacterium]
MTFKLSICIPTYNFGPFIGQTLDSILPQITEAVEIIVLDGGSTDETRGVVEARQRDYSQLKYFHQNFRGGIDRDIEKVVSLARGKYCWLFSADDIMLPNAICKLIDAIQSNDDVYLCEHVLCNLEMEHISDYPLFNNVSHQRLFDLTMASQKKEYFCLARTSEVFFSFLAGPIFKKEIWDKASVPESFRGTCWIVAGHLLSMIPSGIKINYLGEAFLYKREGNDSFSNGSLVNRCKIGIENFQFIANSVFGELSEEAFHIRRVLHRDVPLRSLLYAKRRAAEFPENENMQVLQRLVGIHYSDSTLSNWLKSMIFNIAPPLLLKVIHRLKWSIRKIWK